MAISFSYLSFVDFVIIGFLMIFLLVYYYFLMLFNLFKSLAPYCSMMLSISFDHSVLIIF